ncbi:MAG: thioredoxin, partial [Pseudomonadota bacterium]
MELKSRKYVASDMAKAMELCYAKGWTDGLPVVPPTEARIGAMLTAAGLDPGKEVAFIENRQVSVTAEKVAINAVL